MAKKAKYLNHARGYTSLSLPGNIYECHCIKWFPAIIILGQHTHLSIPLQNKDAYIAYADDNGNNLKLIQKRAEQEFNWNCYVHALMYLHQKSEY